MDKNIRIAIIGGGPAGLSAGMYLEQAGYENYTIYERNGWVGGKCHSPEYKGRRYELGAIMGVPSYYAIHDVEEFCGITHDGPRLNRNYKDLKGNVVAPFAPKKHPLSAPRLLRMKSQIKKFGELLATKYKGYDINGHRGVAQGRYDGYAVSPERERVEGENPNLKDLALPFKDFCELNGVELVQDVWIGPFTSFGYGYFDEIPAAYVLKYLDAFTVKQFLSTGKLWTWKNGTESIWQGVNSHLEHPAVLNTEVTGIRREDGKVTVTLNGKQEEVFDKLIICTPLEMFLGYGDPTAEETELFSKIQNKEYFTMAVRTEDEKSPDISYYYFANMTPETRGHLMVFYHRWPDCGPQPLVTFTLRNHEGMKDVPFEEARDTTLADMAKSGLPVVKTERIDDWYYFPHVSCKDYADGWYDKVEALQGEKNTYFAGEVMAFGDMEETVEYSKDLVRRFFTD